MINLEEKAKRVDELSRQVFSIPIDVSNIQLHQMTKEDHGEILDRTEKAWKTQARYGFTEKYFENKNEELNLDLSDNEAVLKAGQEVLSKEKQIEAVIQGQRNLLGMYTPFKAGKNTLGADITIVNECEVDSPIKVYNVFERLTHEIGHYVMELNQGKNPKHLAFAESLGKINKAYRTIANIVVGKEKSLYNGPLYLPTKNSIIQGISKELLEVTLDTHLLGQAHGDTLRVIAGADPEPLKKDRDNYQEIRKQINIINKETPRFLKRDLKKPNKPSLTQSEGWAVYFANKILEEFVTEALLEKGATEKDISLENRANTFAQSELGKHHLDKTQLWLSANSEGSEPYREGFRIYNKLSPKEAVKQMKTNYLNI